MQGQARLHPGRQGRGRLGLQPLRPSREAPPPGVARSHVRGCSTGHPPVPRPAARRVKVSLPGPAWPSIAIRRGPSPPGTGGSTQEAPRLAVQVPTGVGETLQHPRGLRLALGSFLRGFTPIASGQALWGILAGDRRSGRSRAVYCGYSHPPPWAGRRLGGTHAAKVRIPPRRRCFPPPHSGVAGAPPPSTTTAALPERLPSAAGTSVSPQKGTRGPGVCKGSQTDRELPTAGPASRRLRLAGAARASASPALPRHHRHLPPLRRWTHQSTSTKGARLGSTPPGPPRVLHPLQYCPRARGHPSPKTPPPQPGTWDPEIRLRKGTPPTAPRPLVQPMERLLGSGSGASLHPGAHSVDDPSGNKTQSAAGPATFSISRKPTAGQDLQLQRRARCSSPSTAKTRRTPSTPRVWQGFRPPRCQAPGRPSQFSATLHTSRDPWPKSTQNSNHYRTSSQEIPQGSKKFSQVTTAAA